MKKLITLLTLGMVSFSFVACKSGSSSAPTPTPSSYYGAYNCASCNFQMTSMFRSQGQTSSGSVMLNAEFLGDATAMQNANMMTASTGGCAVHKYTGQVAVQGTLSISTGFYAGQCWVPPGQYSLRTLNAGQYSQGTIMIPSVEATASTQWGMVRLNLKFGSGYGGNMVVQDYGHDCSIDRIGGFVGFQQMITGNGGSQTCNDLVGSFLE